MDPAITIEKTVDADGDGNVLTGAGFNESEAVGANGFGDQTVTYRYALTNTSDASTDPLTITSLSDDNGTPLTLDDVNLLTAAGVTLHKRGGDADELLESGETWIYTYSKTVPVGDAGDEHVNTVAITASDDEGTAASDTDTATVTYADADNDEPPTFSIDDVTVSEAAGTLTFTVTKSGATAVASTVDYAATPDTAGTPGDYAAGTSALTDTLTFLAGESTKTITLNVTNDALFELTESFTVNLSNPTNATIADGQGIGTITDNDTAPAFSIGDMTVSEVAGTVTFTVTKRGADSGCLRG